MAKLKTEIVTVRMPFGTLARIDHLLKGGELRSAFIRKALETEIERRSDGFTHDLLKHRKSDLRKAKQQIEAALRYRAH